MVLHIHYPRYFLTPPERLSCNFLSSSHLLSAARAACCAHVLGFAMRKREPPSSKTLRICATLCFANCAKVLTPALLNSSLILGPIPSTTVRSFAFLSANPAFLAAVRSITSATFDAAGFGAALGVAGAAVAADEAEGAGVDTGVDTGLDAGAATGELALAAGAGTSANLAGAAVVEGVAVALVFNWLAGSLQQHLHIKRLSSQPIKPPSNSQNQQQDKELKNEFIFTPQ